MTDELLAELCSFAADLEFDDLPADVVETAARHVFDSLAVGTLALREPPVRRLVDYAATKHDGSDAPLLGTDRVAAPAYAALANASAIRYLDWNDTYLAAEAAHPSGNLGAILPVAAAEGASGRDVLLATVLAYEVQCRLCDLASFTGNGFDHVNYGLVSVPLAVGRLLGLSEDELGEAVSLAVGSHLGLLQARQAPLSEWKGFAFGNVARNGVVAAELARAGIHGPAEIFAGEHGVDTIVDGDLDAEDLALGDGYRIERTHLKRYPICHHILAAIDAVVDVADATAFDPEDVSAIEDRTYEIAIRATAGEDRWRPTTRATADHSLPYCVARALHDGTIGPDDLAEEHLDDPAVLSIADRVTVEHEPAFTERYGESFTHALTIRTDEAVYERRVDYPLGHHENPLPDSAIAEKVTAHSNCPPEVVGDLEAAVTGLEDADDLDALVEAAGAVGRQL